MTDGVASERISFSWIIKVDAVAFATRWMEEAAIGLAIVGSGDDTVLEESQIGALSLLTEGLAGTPSEATVRVGSAQVPVSIGGFYARVRSGYQRIRLLLSPLPPSWQLWIPQGALGGRQLEAIGGQGLDAAPPGTLTMRSETSGKYDIESDIVYL